MEDKAEKHRLAVQKYREKLGIDKVREMTREYTKKLRDNPEYKQKENEKNKLRAKQYREQIKNQIKNQILNDKIDAATIVDNMLNNLCTDTINDIPEKRGRGRPRLTEEQKAERLALKNTNKNLGLKG